MTPQFSRAVDPIFLLILGLLDRISRQEEVVIFDERLRIRKMVEEAEAIVGLTSDWELAKYALVSWIDEVLVDAPWDGSDWWNNNVLEVELFNTRLANEQFYVRSLQASALPTRDALEVFYVCVVLGFRGLYRDPDAAVLLAEPRGLPLDLDTWARQTALAIRLGQGLPDLEPVPGEGSGAPPLTALQMFVWSSLGVGFLAASLSLAYLLS